MNSFHHQGVVAMSSQITHVHSYNIHPIARCHPCVELLGPFTVYLQSHHDMYAKTRTA